RPSCREPRNPRPRTARTQTGSHAENPRTNQAGHPRPQTRSASPSTANSTQAPTGKDRRLASPHNKLDQNPSLPMQTQKSSLTHSIQRGAREFAKIAVKMLLTDVDMSAVYGCAE